MADADDDPNEVGWAAPGYLAPPPPPPTGWDPPPPAPPPPTSGGVVAPPGDQWPSPYVPAGPPPGYSTLPPPPSGWGQPTPLPPPVGAPIASGAVRSIRGKAVAVAVFAAINVVINIVGVVVDLRLRSLYVEDGVPDRFDAQDAYDASSVISGFQTLMVVAFGIVWIVWQRAHAQNARALGSPSTFGPVGAIWTWFVPLANFVLGPLEVLQSGRPAKRTGLVVAWGVALAVGAFLFLGSVGAAPEEEVARTQGDQDAMIDMATLGVAGMAVLAVAAILAATVALSLSKAQAEPR